jgi:hypothetical protein
MTMVTLSLQPMRDGASSPIGSPGDGHIEIGFVILDHHVLCTGKSNPNTAAFVLAPTGPIFVRKADRDLAQVVTGPAERELQATRGVLTQTIGQRKTPGLNVDLHEVAPVEWNTPDSLK